MITTRQRPAVHPAVSKPRSSHGRVIRRVAAVGGVAVAMIGQTHLAAYAAPGDTSSDTTVANVEVPSAIELTALTPSFTLVGLPGATVTGNGAVSFTVGTNNLGGYSVTVQAASAVLSPSQPGNTDSIPISALAVRESGGGGFTSLSDTSAVTVHTQTNRSDEAGDSLSNDYQVVIPFVASDTYSVTLEYVATAL